MQHIHFAVNAAPAVTGKQSTPVQVLVVEPDDNERDEITKRLSAEGFLVAEAGEAQAAMAVAKGLAPAVAVVEPRLARRGQNGVDLIRNLRALEDRPVVVVYTRPYTLEDGRQLIEAGAYQVVEKPDLDDLVSELRDLSTRNGL